jgi:hypothetical protein
MENGTVSTESENKPFTQVLNLAPAAPSIELVMDAVLIVNKAMRDPEFANWNRPIFDAAMRIVDTATDAAIERVVAALKG